MKKRIIIWGIGFYFDQVWKNIDFSLNEVVALIDIDPSKIGKSINGLYIKKPEDILKMTFDYIMITVKKYDDVIMTAKSLNINDRKIVEYWNIRDKDKLLKNYGDSIERVKKLYENRLESAPYEWGVKAVPTIKSSECLLIELIKTKGSLCRFGDGEFEIIRGNNRPWFQQVDVKLGKRLKSILRSHDNNIYIAVAENFKLGEYTDYAADEIRAYMAGKTRSDILELLELDRIYYDAYVSRPYLMYKDKSKSKKIFELFSLLWEGRNVVVVEGKYSHIGFRNVLFETALSVKRILCPIKNAWFSYELIYTYIISNISRNDIVLISLGPTATVLAYDLGMVGYQAIDIGQIDNEYEWSLMEATVREYIPGKMVAELDKTDDMYDLKNEEFQKQVIASIG